MGTLKMIRPPPVGSDEAFVSVRLKSGEVADLPAYLRVDATGEKDGREYFVIREGHHKSKEASVTKTGGPFLVPPRGHSGGALVQFLPGKKKLRVANMPTAPTVGAFVQEQRQLAAGLHHLFIPDRAHSYSDNYHQAGAYRKTWFGIGHSNGPNYLHPGKHSSGCLAMTDIAQWPSIADYLVRSRLDDLAVGTLQVCRPTADDWCLFFNNRYKLTSLGGEYLVDLVFRPSSDACLTVEGRSVDPGINFRLHGVLPIQDGNTCQTFIPEVPGGGVMQGTWSEKSGDSARGHAGHVRIGVWQMGASNSNLHAPVRIGLKGSVSKGLWGRAGTTKVQGSFEAVEAKERPWYDYPWNPGYPWTATPA